MDVSRGRPIVLLNIREVRGTDGATDCRGDGSVDPVTPGWCFSGRTLVPVLSSKLPARTENFTRVGATRRRGIKGFGVM